MTTPTLRSALLWFLPLLTVCTLATGSMVRPDPSADEKALGVYYLEIVTPDVEAMCESMEKMHGIEFAEPIMEFGNARTAPLEGGGMLGIRGPMRPDEDPVVRPYLLVDDLDAAVEEAKAAGAEIAIPGMELPGRGKFAIYIQGGIQHGLWQN